MDTRRAVAALARELGSMATEVAAEAPVVGGRKPELVLAPQSAADVSNIVVAAARLDLAVAPIGGGTALGSLAPPMRPYVVLSTLGLAGVVEHAAGDMTITARAGTRVAELAAVLYSAKQELPIDVPLAERATMGGMIAVSPSGPRRFGHGTLRDYLLGITVIDAAGRSVRAGGRVVKNVAGYDLMKLHAGARGSLGVVVEATFKVKPTPERCEWLVAGADPETAERVRLGLARAQVPAAALELASAGSVRSSVVRRAWRRGFLLAVGIEGVEPEVRWQEERVREVLATAGAADPVIVHGDEAQALLRHLVDFGAATGDGILVKAAVLPSRLPELIAASNAVLPEGMIVAEVGNGVMRLHLPDASPEALAALRALVEDLGGHAVIEAMPPAVRAQRDFWAGEESQLATRLKAALDPEFVFLPGSYLGLGKNHAAAVAR